MIHEKNSDFALYEILFFRKKNVSQGNYPDWHVKKFCWRATGVVLAQYRTKYIPQVLACYWQTTGVILARADLSTYPYISEKLSEKFLMVEKKFPHKYQNVTYLIGTISYVILAQITMQTLSCLFVFLRREKVHLRCI